MSALSTAASGVSKSVQFLINIFTKTSAVASQVSKLSPGVLAAMLAVFYDVVKTAQSAQGAAVAATSGNVPAAFALSETTLQLVGRVIEDGKNAGHVVSDDLKTLGIAA